MSGYPSGINQLRLVSSTLKFFESDKPYPSACSAFIEELAFRHNLQ